MKLKDIGEFGLIQEIAKITKTKPSVIKGIGDDCAVLKYTKDRYLLFTTDMIIEDVHFKLKNAAPQQIGHKAIAVNISDIAACGGRGKWAVVSAGLPKDLSVDFFKKIYYGMQTTASMFSIGIVGGDTSICDKIVISVVLIGFVDKKNLVLRNGAKAGDVIFLTGKLKARPDDLNFIPKIKESKFLVNNFKINSMIDISDGLLSDLGHILTESKKGACLYESLIPREGAFTRRLLTTGEQFQLLFTADKKYLKAILSKSEKNNTKISAIGEITDKAGKIIFVDRHGNKQELKPEGYKHF